MTQLLKFELIKIYKRKSIYIVLLGLLGIVSLPIFSNMGDGKAPIPYYAKWEGPITEDKIQKVKEEREKYFVPIVESESKGTIEDVRAGVDSQEAFQIEGIAETMAYAQGREHDRKEQIQVLENKIIASVANDNLGYQYRKLKLEKDMLEQVDTSVLYYQKSAREMIDFVNTFGFVISVILILLGLAPMFTNEFTSGVDQFILSSKYGRSKLVTAKLYASLIYVLSIVGAWTVYNIIVRIIVYGNNGWKTPIQFLHKYVNSPYSYTNLEYFLRQIGMHMLAAIGFAIFVIVVSALCKNGLISFFVSGATMGIALMVDTMLDLKMPWLLNLFQFAYYGLMKVEGLFIQFKTVNVLGFPILYPVFAVILLIVTTGLLIKLLYMILMRKEIV
jgi:ABC-type transport system involved in multi-copper enzyme maturation permease subunit